MSAAGCLQGTPVLCNAHNDMLEHTTETRFAPVHVTSEGPRAVGLCVLTPDEKKKDEPSSGIQHRLQPVLQVASSTSKDRVAVVQLGNDQCIDQC